MLTEYESKELARLHQDELDFLYELGSKYNMTKAEVQRLCFFMRIDPAHLMQHTLEVNHVQH